MEFACFSLLPARDGFSPFLTEYVCSLFQAILRLPISILTCLLEKEDMIVQTRLFLFLLFFEVHFLNQLMQSCDNSFGQYYAAFAHG
jgi:hypothetical protein